jgi:hypothetical protein
MPYATQRNTDGAQRYRNRKIDNRLATIEDDLDSGVIGGGGGGGGAPTGAAYVTIGNNATLTAERALTAGSGIAITDGGANSTVTVAASGIGTSNLGGDITTAGKALLDDVDAAAQRTTLGLATIAASGSASDLGAGTVPAARMPALTGDVTMTAGTTTTAIAANAVTNADLADVPTATFKGRTTAGAGDPEDLTATQATALLDTFNSTTKGLVPASGGGTTNFLRADGTWAAPAGGGGGGATIAKSILSATQANSTVTPAVLTGCTFTLLPGQSLTLDAILIFTAAATTTGGALGVRVAQAASANANARGAAHGYVNLSNAAAATGLADGDVFNVAAGANALFQVLGTATTSGNNAAHIKAVVHNASTNVNTTVTVEFRSEVGGSAVTAQIGSGAVAIIG